MGISGFSAALLSEVIVKSRVGNTKRHAEMCVFVPWRDNSRHGFFGNICCDCLSRFLPLTWKFSDISRARAAIIVHFLCVTFVLAISNVRRVFPCFFFLFARQFISYDKGDSVQFPRFSFQKVMKIPLSPGGRKLGQHFLFELKREEKKKRGRCKFPLCSFNRSLNICEENLHSKSEKILFSLWTHHA